MTRDRPTRLAVERAARSSACWPCRATSASTCAALAEADAIARPVRRPEELDGVDGLVIPGGESTTMSKLAIEFGLLEPLRKLIAAGMPVYGSCAGMIMLAGEVLDGRPDQRALRAAST